LNDRGGKILGHILSNAKKLSKYDVGETINGLARKTGRKPSEILKLNSNENFFVPLDFLRSLLKEVIDETDPRIYPRDETRELREALSECLKVSPQEIVIGTGSDQLIDLVSRMFLKRGEEALSIIPTFSIYERCVGIQGASYRAISLRDDFSLDTERLLSSATQRTKLLFLCSPNNPTANQFDRGEIKHLAESFSGLVAVDEAYADFAGDSIVDLARKYEDIVVFRTFSKVFGLASLRLGYTVANERLATVMDERFQLPYSVSLIALKAALRLIEKIDVIRTIVEELKTERSRFIRMLNQIDGVHAFDSNTNFVLFQVQKNSEKVYQALLKKGVIIRNIGRVLKFENCLRVTVAPSPLMEGFLDALKEVLGEKDA